MKYKLTTSPELLRMLGVIKYDKPESYYDTSFDISCPKAINAGLNANSSGCVKRLTAPTVDKCCRQCETGREVLAKVQPDAVILEAKCHCGKKAADGSDTCQKCRDKANKYWEKRNPAKPRYCSRCKAEVGIRVLYCPDCRPIVTEELRVKRNAYKIRKKLLEKQRKIAKQLEGMK